jgi:hypothetical protein
VSLIKFSSTAHTHIAISTERTPAPTSRKPETPTAWSASRTTHPAHHVKQHFRINLHPPSPSHSTKSSTTATKVHATRKSTHATRESMHAHIMGVIEVRARIEHGTLLRVQEDLFGFQAVFELGFFFFVSPTHSTISK